MGEANVLSEQDFESAMTEAKDLVEIVLEQNNTKETRKLKRRLWRIEKAWEALMRWIHTYKDFESEEENDKEEKQINGFCASVNSSPHPYMLVLLFGLPKKLESTILVKEIYRNVDCGQLTFEELSKAFFKFKCPNSYCKDRGKNNWLVRLPWFVGKKIVDAECVVVMEMTIKAKEGEDMVQCFKCWRFGHFSGQCERAIRCRLCAGFHQDSRCSSDSWRCVNCTDMGYKESETLHTATDNQCPLKRKAFSLT